MVTVTEPASALPTPRCPGCDSDPLMIFGPDGPAVCPNPDCHIFMWDRDKTLTELADNMGQIEIRPADQPPLDP